MKPETTKKCPFCGGHLKECHTSIVHNELNYLVRGGLILKPKKLLSFRFGYECLACRRKITNHQMNQMEASLQ